MILLTIIINNNRLVCFFNVYYHCNNIAHNNTAHNNIAHNNIAHNGTRLLIQHDLLEYVTLHPIQRTTKQFAKLPHTRARKTHAHAMHPHLLTTPTERYHAQYYPAHGPRCYIAHIPVVSIQQPLGDQCYEGKVNARGKNTTSIHARWSKYTLETTG